MEHNKPKLALEVLDKLLDDPTPGPRYGYTSVRVARWLEVAGMEIEFRIKGWRDGWKKARHYRRLLRSLTRP